MEDIDEYIRNGILAFYRMFDDSFIVGIDTAKGQYSYHYGLKYWDLFDIKELDKAPVYDGHKPEDISRLLSLL